MTSRDASSARATTLPPSSLPIYERWMAADAFRPADDPPPGAEPFVIIQPPPNVTGALHLGHALHGHRRGHPHPLSPHARRRHAVAARRRSRQHRRPVRPRPHPRRGGGVPRVARPRALSRADVAVHGRDARHHRRPAPPPRRERSTGAASVHDGRGQRAGGARRLHAPVGRRVSSTAARRSSTGVRAVSPRSATSRTSSTRRRARCGASGTTSRGRTARPIPTRGSGRHDATGDDLRRHRRRGASGRRAVSRPGRARGDPAVPRPPPADHRRRACRARRSAPAR